MSVVILERNDNYHLLNSYVRAYKTSKLYKMKINYRKNILRIVKKSLKLVHKIAIIGCESVIFSKTLLDMSKKLRYNESTVRYCAVKSDQTGDCHTDSREPANRIMGIHR